MKRGTHVLFSDDNAAGLIKIDAHGALITVHRSGKVEELWLSQGQLAVLKEMLT